LLYSEWINHVLLHEWTEHIFELVCDCCAVVLGSMVRIGPTQQDVRLLQLRYLFPLALENVKPYTVAVAGRPPCQKIPAVLGTLDGEVMFQCSYNHSDEIGLHEGKGRVVFFHDLHATIFNFQGGACKQNFDMGQRTLGDRPAVEKKPIVVSLRTCK
jgi:hypothetical protein